MANLHSCRKNDVPDRRYFVEIEGERRGILKTKYSSIADKKSIDQGWHLFQSVSLYDKSAPAFGPLKYGALFGMQSVEPAHCRVAGCKG